VPFKRTHYTTDPDKAGPKNVLLVTETGEPADIYLLCAGPYHYIGMAGECTVEERVRDHQLGNGAAFTAWLVAHGYKLKLARTWPNRDKSVEFRLKAWAGARPFCPICSGEIAHTRARYDEYIIEPATQPAEELAF
jgi:hypothetical protein